MSGTERFRSKVLAYEREPCSIIMTEYSYYIDSDTTRIPTRETVSYDHGERQLDHTQSMTDVVTPNFHSRRAAGEIFNNPLESVKDKQIVSMGQVDYRLLRNMQTNFGGNGDPMYQIVGNTWIGPTAYYLVNNGITPFSLDMSMVPDFDTTSLVDRAVTRAHANISYSETNILATAGEFNETVSSLRSMFIRAVRIFRAVRKLDLKYLKKEIKLKELRDRYMEYRYAIRPVIHDVKNILSALQAQSGLCNRTSFRATESDSAKTVTAGPTYTYSNGRSMFTETEASYDVSASAGVLTQLNDLSNATIWGLDHPIEAIWELVPFSFIVDWFFNVGQTIESFTPEPGVSILSSWVTLREKRKVRTRVKGTQIDADPSYWDVACQFKLANLYVEREIISVKRIPDPSRSIIPHIKVRLDAFKLLDLAIIGKQLLGNDTIKVRR